jgi:hypothetical protein
MKPLLLTIALLLIVPLTVAAEPVPSPGIAIVMEGCSPCASGDRATVVLQIDNPAAARGVQVVGLLRHPNGIAVFPLRGHGDVVLIPAGPSSLVLADLVLPVGQAGAWLLEGALIDPQTGVTLARHVVGVVKE